MTAQEIFNQSYLGVLRQGRTSYGPIGCRYRRPDGCKCAAGQVIPDNEYKEDMEGQRFGRIFDRTSIEEMHSGLIEDLQFYHDAMPHHLRGGCFRAEWRARAWKVAKRFSLQMPAETAEVVS